MSFKWLLSSKGRVNVGVECKGGCRPYIVTSSSSQLLIFFKDLLNVELIPINNTCGDTYSRTRVLVPA